MDTIHVELISPDGKPFTARTPVQLTNLRARGYVDAPAESNEPTFDGYLTPTESAVESTEDYEDA